MLIVKTKHASSTATKTMVYWRLQAQYPKKPLSRLGCNPDNARGKSSPYTIPPSTPTLSDAPPDRSLEPETWGSRYSRRMLMWNQWAARPSRVSDRSFWDASTEDYSFFHPKQKKKGALVSVVTWRVYSGNFKVFKYCSTRSMFIIGSSFQGCNRFMRLFSPES